MISAPTARKGLCLSIGLILAVPFALARQLNDIPYYVDYDFDKKAPMIVVPLELPPARGGKKSPMAFVYKQGSAPFSPGQVTAKDTKHSALFWNLTTPEIVGSDGGCPSGDPSDMRTKYKDGTDIVDVLDRQSSSTRDDTCLRAGHDMSPLYRRAGPTSSVPVYSFDSQGGDHSFMAVENSPSVSGVIGRPDVTYALLDKYNHTEMDFSEYAEGGGLSGSGSGNIVDSWIFDEPSDNTFSIQGGSPSWTTSNPTPKFGSNAWHIPNASGNHQRYFNDGLTYNVDPDGALSFWVYIRSGSTRPNGIQIQLREGSTWKRVHWGQLVYGNSSTSTYMGGLPQTGKWVQLSASYSDFSGGGLTPNAFIRGVAWSISNGEAWFDRTVLGGDHGDESVTVEKWNSIGATDNVSDLVSVINAGTKPSEFFSAESLRTSGGGDSYGQRVRGYITPPTSGSYTFRIASDNQGEFRISSDANPANLPSSPTSRISSGWVAADNWGSGAVVPGTVSLNGGQRYYFEVLHKEGGGGDHFSVAWEASGMSRRLITKEYLEPYTGASPGGTSKSSYYGYHPKTIYHRKYNNNITFQHSTVNVGGHISGELQTRQTYRGAGNTDIHVDTSWDTIAGATVTGGVQVGRIFVPVRVDIRAGSTLLYFYKFPLNRSAGSNPTHHTYSAILKCAPGDSDSQCDSLTLQTSVQGNSSFPQFSNVTRITADSGAYHQFRLNGAGQQEILFNGKITRYLVHSEVLDYRYNDDPTLPFGQRGMVSEGSIVEVDAVSSGHLVTDFTRETAMGHKFGNLTTSRRYWSSQNKTAAGMKYSSGAGDETMGFQSYTYDDEGRLVRTRDRTYFRTSGGVQLGWNSYQRYVYGNEIIQMRGQLPRTTEGTNFAANKLNRIITSVPSTETAGHYVNTIVDTDRHNDGTFQTSPNPNRHNYPRNVKYAVCSSTLDFARNHTNSAVDTCVTNSASRTSYSYGGASGGSAASVRIVRQYGRLGSNKAGATSVRYETTVNTHDSAGNVTSVTSRGVTTNFDYGSDRVGLDSVTVPGLGTVTYSGFNRAFGTYSRVTNANGFWTDFNYDALGRYESMADRGGFTQSVTVSRCGSNCDSRPNAAVRVESSRRGVVHPTISIIDRDGQLSRMKREFYTDGNSGGRRTSITDYTYDADTLQLTRVDGPYQSGTSIGQRYVTYSHNERWGRLGQINSRWSSPDNITTYNYDGVTDPTTASMNISRVRSFGGDNNAGYHQEHTVLTGPLGVKSRITTGHNSNNTVAVTSREDLSYTYSGNNNYKVKITSVVDSATNGGSLTTVRKIDDFGNVYEIYGSTIGRRYFDFNRHGLERGYLLSRNTTTLNTQHYYDTFGRVSQIRNNRGGTTEYKFFTYDSCTNGIGRLCRTTERIGSAADHYQTDYEYNRRGFVIRRDLQFYHNDPDTSKRKSYTYQYEYENDKLRLRDLTYPDGSEVRYHYNNNSEVYWVSDPTGPTYWRSTQRNIYGQTTRADLGGGTLTSYRDFDIQGLPTSVRMNRGGTQLRRQDYDRDRLNLVTSRTDSHSSFPNETYVHDQLNRFRDLNGQRKTYYHKESRISRHRFNGTGSLQNYTYSNPHSGAINGSSPENLNLSRLTQAGTISLGYDDTGKLDDLQNSADPLEGITSVDYNGTEQPYSLTPYRSMVPTELDYAEGNLFYIKEAGSAPNSVIETYRAGLLQESVITKASGSQQSINLKRIVAPGAGTVAAIKTLVLGDEYAGVPLDERPPEQINDEARDYGLDIEFGLGSNGAEALFAGAILGVIGLGVTATGGLSAASTWMSATFSAGATASGGGAGTGAGSGGSSSGSGAVSGGAAVGELSQIIPKAQTLGRVIEMAKLTKRAGTTISRVSRTGTFAGLTRPIFDGLSQGATTFTRYAATQTVIRGENYTPLFTTASGTSGFTCNIACTFTHYGDAVNPNVPGVYKEIWAVTYDDREHVDIVPNYVLVVEPGGSYGTRSQVAAWPESLLRGGIEAEVWNGISGGSVSTLKTEIGRRGMDTVRYYDEFEITPNTGSNYGLRVRGYIYPPETGTYEFRFVTDDTGEFYLSTSAFPDDLPSTPTSRTTAWAPPNGYNDGDVVPGTVSLQGGGRAYYFEAYMKEGGGGDNMQLYWNGPSGSAVDNTQVVDGAYLAPYKEGTVNRNLGRQYAAYDGGNDRLRLSSSSTQVDLGTEWTASATFAGIAPGTGWKTLFRGNDNDHQIIIRGSDGLLGTFLNGNGSFISSGFQAYDPAVNGGVNGLNDGQFHTITAVATEGKTLFIVDGIPVGAINRRSTTDIGTIGNHINGGQRFADRLDNVQIHNVALDADDIFQITDGQPISGGLQARYDFEGDTDASITDKAGGNNTPTNTGVTIEDYSPGGGGAAPTNVALNKPATQGSTNNASLYPASNAVDGNLSTFNHTLSNQSTNWLEVDLEGSYEVREITIDNRNCCSTQNRVRDVDVIFKDASGSEITRHRINGALSLTIPTTYAPSPPVQGVRYVRIDNGGTYLHIDELFVMGVDLGSSNPTFDPMSIPGLQLWLDAADISTITLSGSTVSTWANKGAAGGSANAVSDPALVISPEYAGASGASPLTVVLDSNDYFNVDAPGGSANDGLNFLAGRSHTAFIVTKQENWTNIYGAANGGSGSGSLHVGYRSNSQFRTNYWGNDCYKTINSSQHNAGQGNILNFVWIPGNRKEVFANGYQAGPNCNSAGNITNMAGGGRIGNVVGHGNYQGSIAEILMYTAPSGQEPLTTTQRQQIEGYLANKWGLVDSLPLGHPGRTSGGPLVGLINLNDYSSSLQSFGGSGQDKVSTGAVTIGDGGASLSIDGNRWQRILFNYTVTPNTMLEFDYESTAQPEVSGIGFHTDDSVNGTSQSRSFQVYGTQNWGNRDQTYTAGSGNTQHFTIRVGDYFTGSFSRLFFANDDDAAAPYGNGKFSNIQIYEAP